MIINVNEDLIVGDSLMDENDIIIKDRCGRYTPIYKDHLWDLIHTLSYLADRDEDFRPIGTEEGAVEIN